MYGVNASNVVEHTLNEISKQYGIDLTSLRKSHQPILEALQEDANTKLVEAKADGFEQGRMESELRHLYLSELGFGIVGRGADAFDKARIHSIIDSSIRLGGEYPGTLTLNNIRALQSELECCTSIDEVVALLEDNRSQICTGFGVKDAGFDDCLADIRSLGSPADLSGESRALMRLNESLLLIAENGSQHEQN